MFSAAIQERTPGPSFYYAMLAAARFQRTAGSCRTSVGTLHDFGCKYLAKAGYGVTDEPMSEYFLARVRRADVKASGRHPWTAD
jgi:hypothetical protein